MKNFYSSVEKHSKNEQKILPNRLHSIESERDKEFNTSSLPLIRLDGIIDYNR